MTESIDAVDGDDIRYVFTTRQKSTVVPDSYRIELATGRKRSSPRTSIARRGSTISRSSGFRVTRVDGLKFWVKVTTSPKAKETARDLLDLSARYADQADYDAKAGRGGLGGACRRPAARGRFNAPTPRSMAILTLAGYAVVEPDVPIVGPTGRMNDNYVPDLRNSLWAAIDECDKRLD